MVRAMGTFWQGISDRTQGRDTDASRSAARFLGSAPPDMPYVPPAAAATPKPGSTVTVLGAPAKPSPLNGSDALGAFGAGADRNKTLLGV